MTDSMKHSVELQQLTRWAEGQDALPQLLVLGYTSWITLQTQMAYLLYSLDMVQAIHRIAVSLLQQIGRRTRVIVTSQTRYKTSAGPGILQLFGVAYGDPTYDWSEAMFLHHMRRHSQHESPSAPSSRSSPLSEHPAGTVPRPPHRSSQPRDHLVPQVDDGGVWWWDTIVPLSLAENFECEELYFRGLTHHPLYTNMSLKCRDDNHAGSVTLRDMVSMLLNLMCNSVLGPRAGLCCS
ncbi:hypothetical protein GWK47_047697 [Chionoecetes opilio]|uniref:Uncharacterized protein n=1 Tax=Chionoecetes opilio TaxID=41210 RepID=A0A8J4Y4F9_CHIOP|nr:hypothetical protein GWK47_047697 [Chionoecetes opilio]